MSETAHHVALPDGYSDKMREGAEDIREVASLLCVPRLTMAGRKACADTLEDIANYLGQMAGAYEGRFDG